MSKERFLALSTALLLALLLVVEVLGAIEKSGGLGASAEDGVYSDSAKILLFFITGLILSRNERSHPAIAFCALGLNLIDKLYLVVRTSLLASESLPTLSNEKLLFGVVAIFLTTSPLAIAAALSGGFGFRYVFAATESSRSANLSNTYVAFSLCALLLPVTYALNFYALLLVHEFPIFYLAISNKMVVPLQLSFLFGAVVLAVAWVISSVRARRATNWVRVALGTVALVVSLRALAIFVN